MLACLPDPNSGWPMSGFLACTAPEICGNDLEKKSHYTLGGVYTVLLLRDINNSHKIAIEAIWMCSKIKHLLYYYYKCRIEPQQQTYKWKQKTICNVNILKKKKFY